MNSFIQKLKENAFNSLSIEGYIQDIHGWMDPQFSNVFENIIISRDRKEPLTIIEVGSWKGLSCITMANSVKKMGFTNVNIIAIDTWLGAPEFWTWGIDDLSRGGSLKLENGYPSVFRTFTKNIKFSDNHDIVAPFPISSIQAIDVLNFYKITADVIYIDASHEYEAVKNDISGYWGLLKNNGSIIGDDYTKTHWPGVVKAVDEFPIKANITGVVWRIDKTQPVNRKIVWGINK
jgi:hypothetical protein